MFHRVLMAVDGSFNSESAGRYAIALAESSNAQLYVVFVVSDDLDDEEVAAGRRSVDHIVERARGLGVEAEGIIERGAVVPAIRNVVEKYGIDLSIAAARHADVERRFFVRSVSRELTVTLPSSMLVVRVLRPGRPSPYRKILAPVRDWRYNREERVNLLTDLARHFKSRIVLFNVREVPYPTIRWLTVEKGQRLRAEGTHRMEPLAEELRARDIEVDVRVEIDTQARRTLLIEAAGGYDLMVLGATRRNILKQVVSGNPIEEALRSSPCDIMIWRPRG